MTKAEFGRWLEQSSRGESVVYHYGHYGYGGNGDHATRVAAWKAYEAGLVSLVQRREVPRTAEKMPYEYIAQRL